MFLGSFMGICGKYLGFCEISRGIRGVYASFAGQTTGLWPISWVIAVGYGPKPKGSGPNQPSYGPNQEV